MGWDSNSRMSWQELRRRLSDPAPVRAEESAPRAGAAMPAVADPLVASDEGRRKDGRPPAQPHGDGGDSPAWSRKRKPFRPTVTRRPGTVRYAELHAHSNFSFLDGASHPEELAEEAARLGLEALALTDHDGCYGVVRFAEAARAVGLPTVFGAELSLGLPKPQNGVADPVGEHLLVLARGADGYHALSRAIGEAHLRADAAKGRPVYDLDRLAELGRDRWLVLTGCRKGAVRRALARGEDGERELRELVERFGHVAVELTDHGDPLDAERNDALAALAARVGVPTVATNAVHYATPGHRPLATALAAIRARRSLDELDGWLPAAATAHLRSGAEQAYRFRRWPGAVERAAELGLDCAFDLALVAPKLPPFEPRPDGLDEMGFLRKLVAEGALRRYGPRDAERVKGAYAQLDYELDLIERLGFPGYFLVVWDIARFCRDNDIYCQGRGSAANSAVCYVLDITKVDSVSLKLLFERFLSPERDGPPDIDVDIESDRREEVLQYVYAKYGRQNAAQVANVVSYRARNAIRDLGKALGHSTGQVDAWSRKVDPWGSLSESTEASIPPLLLELTAQLQHYPRHLGIHSGGMVICDRPVIEVCPVEWARMEGRSVLQWDKDDCAAIGLVKFDLLGLGMLSALHYAVDFVRAATGEDLDLAELPQDPAVYEMLSRADTVGVFQVESRAQMATLPRLRPKEFYDIVVEVALIRPGPIQGGSVHPYLRRRHGLESSEPLHPLLKNALDKTLGVPLFQEQLMQMAIDVAGFTPAEADELRLAMGAKRSRERMERLRQRLLDGMAAKGIPAEIRDVLYDKLVAFANYGFPESHAVSFAYLVYASAYLKLHHPAAFCAALLNAQPMGFYSPQSLVSDARRHGVRILPVDVNHSRAVASLPDPNSVRLALSSVKGISEELAQRIEAGQPYDSMADAVRRGGLTARQAEAMALAGGFDGFERNRRKALWAAAALAGASADRLDLRVGDAAPALGRMSELDEVVGEVESAGIARRMAYPTAYLRTELHRLGAVPAARLHDVPDGRRVLVVGAVTHRQRPATANGTTFLNLEDETGLINVICSREVWERFRDVIVDSNGLLVRGVLRNSENVCNVVAHDVERYQLPMSLPSRNFM